MALNTREMWSSGVKMAFFPKNYQNLPCGWGRSPQTPVCDTLELRKFTKHVSHFRHFRFLSFGLSHLRLAKLSLSAEPGF